MENDKIDYKYLYKQADKEIKKQADRVKELESNTLKSIITMGTESLDPDQFMQLEKIVDRLGKK